MLWEMARWRPVGEAFAGAEKPDRPALLRELEAHWQRHRQSGTWWWRASAWLAGAGLHQAGLATESPESFRETYLSAVAQEKDSDALFVLAQWGPGEEAPAAFHREWRRAWQHRLEDKEGIIGQVAVLALLRQALEQGDGEALRRVALEVWRTGTKEGQTARQIAGAALSRFHEVRTAMKNGKWKMEN